MEFEYLSTYLFFFLEFECMFCLGFESAEQFGLPLLRPSLQNNPDVSKGVNFAVGGATSINVDFFERNKVVNFKLLNSSLNVQLDWFEKLKPAFCKTAGLRHAPFLSSRHSA